ncbi:ribonuclease H-like domain-containing protein [Tanacetum coccineum]
MEAYFQKIESLVTILQSLDCIVNDEDVIHYALEGLPEKYNQVCGYMHYENTFPDLKTARSLLITEEMGLKTKEVALPADSFSQMVLMAQTGTNRRPSNPQVKSWRPCFNFAKGSCRFGSKCRYAHDPNAKPRDIVTSQFDTPTVPVAFSNMHHPSPMYYLPQPTSSFVAPPGFTYPSSPLLPQQAQPTFTPPGFGVLPAQQFAMPQPQPLAQQFGLPTTVLGIKASQVSTAG